ncbi:MAG TPA: hypothetical protein VEL28_11965 [Candidatus Binatia bacterium]|nr:hypothetical protein [Candidatus Binatia bacterium]
MKTKIANAIVPKPRTSIGIDGSLGQKEVGGPACPRALAAIVYAL